MPANTHHIQALNQRIRGLRPGSALSMTFDEARTLQAELVDLLLTLRDLQHQVGELQSRLDSSGDIKVEIKADSF
jgi:hypothetical protein